MKTKRIITIGDSEYHYSSSYFTSNKWADNDTFVGVRSKHPEIGFFYERNFKKPFNDVAHLMVCPENHELMFFCHEGETFYISNRLWLYDMGTGKEWNIAKQTLDRDGNLGDCFGHEMWTPDGKGLYFVKYDCSSLPSASASFTR